ncbi:glycosyltransferase family 4 protein [Photobacterium leiognathi]|uniref:glycosyltransferase family 4 protein n=1 Tax=Photobacterium leiognathi TaxID=553611 RepID=UPI00298242A9|nr:glycosyltransferase family 4 protein [Photobacterium leiognathi]
MKVLHFCTYYMGSTVYKDLFSKLKNCNIEQLVFVPVRDKKHIDNNRVEGLDISYVYCLSIFTKLFYILKLFILTILSLYKYKRCDVDYVHAHTLYADGIPAYIYALTFKKRLIITLRNTDVNVGFKFYPHYKWLAKKSLSYCDSIVFISKEHRSIFIEYFGDDFSNKIKVIPNGLTDYYIDNAVSKRSSVPSVDVGLYIGCCDKNKNIKMAIESFFHSTDNKSLFYIVGFSHDDYKNCYGLLDSKYEERVTFWGRKKTEEIVNIIDRSSVFIMVSHYETFGLVYLEAISRCVPVIYTEGQGFDGAVNDFYCGESCNPNDICDISNKITKVLDYYPKGLIFPEKNIVTKFSWNSIANNYIKNIYKKGCSDD